MVEIRVFGSPSILNDGVAVEMSCRKGWSLLAILALSGGAPVARGRIAGELWPENDEQHARRALATTLWRLGRTCAVPLIEARGEQLSLAAGVRCDLAEFRKLVHRGCDLGDVAALEAAVALQTADLLPEEDEPWCRIERESLRALLVVALDKLLAQYRDRADARGALSAARRLIAIEPYMEHAHRGAIEALGALGERLQAVKQFRSWANFLQQELGVAPMPETLAALRAAIGAEPTWNLQDDIVPERDGRLRPASGDAFARLRGHLNGARLALEELSQR